MTDQERLAEWTKLINRYNDLIGSKLPEETGKAWYAELKRFDFLIVSLAIEEVCKHNKMRGWPPFGAVLEKCEANAAEARRAEEEQRKREELRRAVEVRGGDGLGFVEAGNEGGDFTEAVTIRFAKAIYIVSQRQEGRDWLCKQVCCPGDGTSPKQGGQVWDWQRILEPWGEPRPMPLCIILAKCMRNAINCTRNGDRLDGQRIAPEKWPTVMAKERAEMREYVSRIVNKASELKRIDGKMAAAGGV